MKKWKTCSRGHRFQKSSDCPVCPICWSGYYKKRSQSDFPQKLGTPALRALLNANIQNLKQLSKWSAAELLELHGMGPKALGLLKAAMRKHGLSFRKSSVK